MRREENQLDATEWLIALVICSTWFGHFYAHHQELETIHVLLPRVVCVMPWLLVVCGQVLFEQHPSSRTHSLLPCTWPPTTNNQGITHTTHGNNTCIVSCSWRWAYKCPKHVEQITSEINHSVASTWFSSLLIYNDARTNIHQIHWHVLFP